MLRTPRAAQFALRYVLLNARKHQPAALPCGFVDEYSSAPWFDGFSRPASLAFGASTARHQWAHLTTGATSGADATAPPIAPPRSWLLRVGYQRAGPFDIDDTPSA